MLTELLKSAGIEVADDAKGKLEEGLSALIKSNIDDATKGLMAKNEELLGEKKAEKRKRDEAEAAMREKERAKAEEDGNYQQLFKSQEGELERLKAENAKLNADIDTGKVTARVEAIAAGLTSDTNRAQLLKNTLSQRLKVVDGEIKVTDESGQLTVSSIDDLTNTIKEKYSFLVDGGKSSGGGATTPDGSADPVKKTLTRSEFNALNASEKMKFMKDDGGSIESDHKD